MVRVRVRVRVGVYFGCDVSIICVHVYTTNCELSVTNCAVYSNFL